jgi:protein-tyrosine phosphatase
MRAAAPVGLPPEGLKALAALKLRTAIDLREPVERRETPVHLERLDVDLRSVPVLDGGVDVNTAGGLPELYAAILSNCGARIAEVVGLLACPGAMPAVLFCSAGKDRTGLVCAVVLSAIGVQDEAVARDFARSEEAMSPAFRSELALRAIRAGVTEQALAVTLGAPRELMLDVLAGLRDEHGGAAAYLIANGLAPAEVRALRASLV